MISSVVRAVLFDRDGTLVEDVPYSGDPAALRLMPGARAVVERLRAAGLRIGVVTNQSGLARGYFTHSQLEAVHLRLEAMLGPVDTWQICPHDDTTGCSCRKPRPGLVLAAAAALGVSPDQCVVVGDIGSDVAAAQAAGAVGLMVPTERTRRSEVAAAPFVCADLPTAADVILGRTAADVILGRTAAAAPAPTGERGSEPLVAPSGRRVLAVRADSAGDVLVTGPAIRAVASRAATVTLLCGPRGRAAAELLPGVDDLIEWTVPWLDPRRPSIKPDDVGAVVKQIEEGEYDQGIIFTSFHQSPLPTALLLRLAGVAHVSAISDDYPGSLLDVRHRVRSDVAESERALSLARAAGYPLARGDNGRPRVRRPLPDVRHLIGEHPYIVVHPGASVPARACPPARCAEFVSALRGSGRRVVVTGAPGDAALTRFVAGDHALDLGGRTSLAELAAVLAGAQCAVVGNTGPAHVAAAVGTAVVSLFAPTVPYERWRPYGVPVVRLGDADAPCRDSRATLCPAPNHPCLSNVEISEVLAAVKELTCES